MATLLGPVSAKLKKATKRVEKLEATVEELRKVGDDLLPAMRKQLATDGADAASKLERAQAELAQCASKTSLEVARQEQLSLQQQTERTMEQVEELELSVFMMVL